MQKLVSIGIAPSLVLSAAMVDEKFISGKSDSTSGKSLTASAILKSAKKLSSFANRDEQFIAHACVGLDEDSLEMEFTLDQIPERKEDVEWGKCTTRDYSMKFDVRTSDLTMTKLIEVLGHPSPEGMEDQSGLGITDWIERSGPDTVHYGPREFSLANHDVVAQGEAMLELEKQLCENGMLDTKIDSLKGSCRQATGKIKFPDHYIGELGQCMLERGPFLSNADRRLLQAISQIQKDLERVGDMLSGAQRLEDESDDDYDEFLASVPIVCERLAAIWLIRVVPWFDFIQGSAEACLHLYGLKRLDEETTMKGLIVLRDKITRVSRYSNDNIQLMEKWLAFYWGRVLRKYFPDPFVTILSDTRFFTGIDSHLLRFSSGDPAMMDFVFEKGRPGLFALYFAKLWVCFNSYNLYVRKMEDVPSEIDLDDYMRTFMGVPEGVSTPQYMYGELDFESIHDTLISSPENVCFGSWQCRDIIAKANEILGTKFTPNGGTHAGESKDILSKASAIFSSVFSSKSESKSSAAPPERSLKRGQGLKKRLGAISPESDEVQPGKVSSGLPKEIPFSKLVELVDVLVDGRMGELANRLEISKRIYSDELSQALALLAMETTWDASSVHVVRIDHTRMKGGKVGSECAMITSEQIAAGSTVAAVHEAIRILSENSALGSSTKTLDTESLAELIAAHEPQVVQVDGVSRSLPLVEYDSMQEQLLARLDFCARAQTLSWTDIHGCLRPLPSDEELERLVSGRHSWFLTEFLTRVGRDHDAVTRGQAWAIVRIREESQRLEKYRFLDDILVGQLRDDLVILPMTPAEELIITRHCEEILAVYALIFANSPDAIMNGEPMLWCYSLMNMPGSGLSKGDIVHAISLMSNKIVGLSRFGPDKAKLYIFTLASYWVSALSSFNAEFAEAIAHMEERQGRAAPVETAVKTIQGMGLRSAIHAPKLLWEFIFQHGRDGFFAVFVSGFASRLAGKQSISAYDLIHTASSFLETGLPAGEETHISFRALVQAVDALVDGAMSLHAE